MDNPRNMPEALAALKLAIKERDMARMEANVYYLALESALARHAAEIKQLKEKKND